MRKAYYVGSNPKNKKERRDASFSFGAPTYRKITAKGMDPNEKANKAMTNYERIRDKVCNDLEICKASEIPTAHRKINIGL